MEPPSHQLTVMLLSLAPVTPPSASSRCTLVHWLHAQLVPLLPATLTCTGFMPNWWPRWHKAPSSTDPARMAGQGGAGRGESGRGGTREKGSGNVRRGWVGHRVGTPKPN